MLSAIGIFVAIKTRLRGQLIVSLMSKAARNFLRCHRLVRCAIDFHAVASREQQNFREPARSQIQTGFGTAPVTLTRLNSRLVMTQADTKQIHGECVCAVNVIPHSSVSAALNPIMHSAATLFGASRCRWRPCKMAP